LRCDWSELSFPRRAEASNGTERSRVSSKKEEQADGGISSRRRLVPRDLDPGRANAFSVKVRRSTPALTGAGEAWDHGRLT